MSGKTGQSQSEPSKPTGRPSSYTDEVADEICTRLYESEEGELPETLLKICRDPRMPSRPTVHRWLSDIDGFRAKYARARELRKDALTERLMCLSRDAITHAHGAPGTGEAGARIQAIKLEIDTIKWILSKEYAHDYGDKIKQEISGPDGAPIASAMEITSDIENRIKEIAKISAVIQPPSGYEPTTEA
jgi:hypothetical protein